MFERSAGPQAADALRAPFVLGEKSNLVQLAKEAGVASIEVATRIGTAKFPTVRALVEADLRGWLPVMGVFLEEAKIQQILEEAEEVLSPYVNEQGQAVFPVSAHIISGIKSSAHREK